MKCPLFVTNEMSGFINSVSSRRGGGKVRIPRSLRDLQVERKSLFCDFCFQRLFHGLDLFFGQRRQEFSFCTVVSDAMSCDHERQGSVQVLMDDHLASSQGGAPLGTLDL